MLFLEKKIGMENFYWKTKFVQKKTCWEKILLEKYLLEKKNLLGKQFLQEKNLLEKKIWKFFLSESGGFDECDLICNFVYQMGRLCGGAHEISDIKAPLFLCGWVVCW